MLTLPIPKIEEKVTDEMASTTPINLNEDLKNNLRNNPKLLAEIIKQKINN